MGLESLGHRALAVLLTASLWMLGLPMPAAAATMATLDGARAAILPLEVQGELSEADRESLTSELVEGLRRGDFEVVTPQEVSAASSEGEACQDASCVQKVARATQATQVVRATVVVEDRDYHVSVQLFDGATGRSLAVTEEGCEICGINDAGDLVAAAAATLRTKLDALAKGPASLEVTSTPGDAQVFIDGELVGTTPLEQPVIAGKRVLRISKEGYITIEREVTFVEGVAESLGFELEKVPTRLPSRPWGWVSLGVGLAGVGTAVGFAWLDDRPYRVGSACDPPNNQDANEECRRLWKTQWIVLGTALAGAALTTLGVAVLLSTTSRRKAGRAKRSARRPSFGVGPGSVTLQGRF
jgi:TolB-like protein